MKVWEAMANKSPVITVAPTATVARAIGHLVESRIRALPVLDNGRLVGIITTRDIMSALDARGSDALEQSVADTMTRDPVTADRDESIEKIENIFVERQISHIPVLSEGKLVGLLTPADVFGSHLGDVEWLNEHLRAYVAGA